MTHSSEPTQILVNVLPRPFESPFKQLKKKDKIPYKIQSFSKSLLFRRLYFQTLLTVPHRWQFSEKNLEVAQSYILIKLLNELKKLSVFYTGRIHQNFDGERSSLPYSP